MSNLQDLMDMYERVFQQIKNSQHVDEHVLDEFIKISDEIFKLMDIDNVLQKFDLTKEQLGDMSDEEFTRFVRKEKLKKINDTI